MNLLYTNRLNGFVEYKTKKPLKILSPLSFSFTVSSFCCNLFSSAKISLAPFLVLLYIPVTSVAIC